MRAATPAAEALRRFGRLCCAAIAEGVGGWQPRAAGPIALPPLAAVVAMDRGSLLALAERLSLCAPAQWHARAPTRQRWGRYLGGIALSYARVGDTAAVAALARAAGHHGLRSAWLSEAVEYLLDQQQPEGAFGLLALEVAALDRAAAEEAVLRLTVEVLWALAECVMPAPV